jgi:hypothetical protein
VQRKVRTAPFGATGRVSTVAVADVRQRGQVVVTVDTMLMVLAGPDAARRTRSGHLRLGVVGTDEPWLTTVPPAEPAGRLEDTLAAEANCPPAREGSLPFGLRYRRRSARRV